MERFKSVDLHPDRIDNATMGTIFEELIRRFNEALDENPGEHFTPRDVVHLMVDLMLAGDEARIARPGWACSVYDPCCGSGGMLMIAKEHIISGMRVDRELLRPAINAHAENQPVWAGGQPRDLGGLQVGHVHEGPDGAGCGQHRLWQHAVQRPACRATVRLPDRQSAVR